MIERLSGALPELLAFVFFLLGFAVYRWGYGSGYMQGYEKADMDVRYTFEQAHDREMQRMSLGEPKVCAYCFEAERNAIQMAEDAQARADARRQEVEQAIITVEERDIPI